MRKILWTALAIAAGATSAWAQNPSVDAAQQQRAQDKRGLMWDDRPTIVFGQDITLSLRGKLQLDWREFDPDIGAETYDFRTARVALKGDLTRHFDYEVERSIDRDGNFADWKDVYLNWTTFATVRVKAGRFKMPFGLEQNTGATDVDFAYRSLASSAIAPARDRGVMAYGEFDRYHYEIGVFEDDGDNGELKEPQFVVAGEKAVDVGPSFAGRLTADVSGANVGVAYTNAAVPEGLNSLRGESVWGTADFFAPVYVKGRRERFGAQFEWTPGPVGVKAEWMRSREQRREQGNRNEDLSPFIGTGWYVSGTWFITGENKDNNINPRKPIFQGGIGAIELGARYDQLSFGSTSQTGTPFANPRADRLLTNANHVWTFGANLMLNRWLRLMTNAIHEDFTDVVRTPDPGTSGFWSGVVRLQFVF